MTFVPGLPVGGRILVVEKQRHYTCPCYYASGSNNKLDHLVEIEILVEIQEIDDTTNLVFRCWHLSGSRCVCIV